MENRINILGASGCGTSTLGRALAQALHIPCLECDDYYHAPTDPPFQKQYSPEERYAKLCRDLEHQRNFILCGGIFDWVPKPPIDFTCVVFLYVPTDIRIERLKNRERERFGARIQPGGDMHQAHLEFLEWASHYDSGHLEGKSLIKHEAHLRNQLCTVLEFRVPAPVTILTSQILEAIGKPKNSNLG